MFVGFFPQTSTMSYSFFAQQLKRNINAKQCIKSNKETRSDLSLFVQWLSERKNLISKLNLFFADVTETRNVIPSLEFKTRNVIPSLEFKTCMTIKSFTVLSRFEFEFILF